MTTPCDEIGTSETQNDKTQLSTIPQDLKKEELMDQRFDLEMTTTCDEIGTSETQNDKTQLSTIPQDLKKELILEQSFDLERIERERERIERERKRKTTSESSTIPEDLKKELFLHERFDCKKCHGNCNRRRICCDGKSDCKLRCLFDEQNPLEIEPTPKILFWCGSVEKYVSRKQFCENDRNAEPEKFVNCGRPNGNVLTFCGEIFSFHEDGETHFKWPKNASRANNTKIPNILNKC